MNSLLTLILSNAEGDVNAVLSPNSTVPCPGNVTIGLILARYRSSLLDCFGLKASLVIPKYCPLENPAGENHGS